MSTDRSSKVINQQILEEAATWFVEINEDEPDRSVRERFDEWLRRSPEHVRAYLRTLPVWEQGAALDTQANGDPKALIAWAREGNNIVALKATPGNISPSKAARLVSRPWLMAASVAFLCASLAISGWWFFSNRFVYETGIGEQRLISLSDGSRIELNSRSRLRVHYDRSERGIELLKGQALFRVAKETGRPFVVRSADVSIRALGTQFDVYRKSTGIVVTVVEGRVVVAPSDSAAPIQFPSEQQPEQKRPVVLSAGQRTVMMPRKPAKAEIANVTAATAWTQQRLEFSGASLAEVVEEFNRYNEHRLVLQDGALRNFNVTGTFSSSEPASLVNFLRAQPGIHIEQRNDTTVISGE